MTYTQFADQEGANLHQAPYVPGGYRATYNTGTGNVPASQAQIDAMTAAGMHVLLYDQWPGLASFAAGRSHIADVETDAGTIADVDAAIVKRRLLGETLHTVYCSLSPLPAVKASIADRTGVMFGVANYNWSLQEAEQFLAANPDCGYAQYGSPSSNPATLVPGTNVTLSQCNADINVAKDTWLNAIFTPQGADPMQAFPGVWQAGNAGQFIPVGTDLYYRNLAPDSTWWETRRISHGPDVWGEPYQVTGPMTFVPALPAAPAAVPPA